MKVTLLLVLLVVIWRWTCAHSPPEIPEASPAHRCEHTEPINDLENPQRTKRNVITSLTGTVKNATKYIGRKLHIIRKRDMGDAETSLAHGEHLKPGNRTEDGKKVVSKSKRNVTLSDKGKFVLTAKNTTETASKVKRGDTFGNTSETAFAKPSQKNGKRIKRNATEQGNKTHIIHRRREISISKNASNDDVNCIRPRRDNTRSKPDETTKLNRNDTNNNNQSSTRESRELDKASAKGTNSSTKLESEERTSNKASRQVQNSTKVSKDASKARNNTKKSKNARLPRDLTESRKNASLENNENISKLANTTSKHALKRTKRAVSESDNTTAKSDKTNEHLAVLARLARELFNQNATKASNKTKSDAQTRTRTTRNVPKYENGTSESNLNDTKAQSVTKLKREVSQQKNETITGSKRVTREVSETKELEIGISHNETTTNSNKTSRDVSKSTNDTKISENKKNTKTIARKTRKVSRSINEANKSDGNFPRLGRGVSESINITNNTEIGDAGKTVLNSTRATRNVPELENNQNNKNSQNLTRVTRDVSESKNVSKHLGGDSQESYNITRTKRKASNATIKASEKNKTLDDKSIAIEGDKNVQNLTRTRRETPKSENNNITKIKRENLELDNATEKSENIKKTKDVVRVIRDISKSNNATKKSDKDRKNVQASARVSRNVSELMNDTKANFKKDQSTRITSDAPKSNRSSNEDHRNTHNNTKENNLTTTSGNNKNAKNLRRKAQDFPRPNNTTTKSLVGRNNFEPKNVTKVINRNTQNIRRIRGDVPKSDNTTKHLDETSQNITKTKRDIPAAKAENNNSSSRVKTNNTTGNRSDGINRNISMSKRNVSEIKNVTKRSDRDHESSHNITRMDRDISMLNNGTTESTNDKKRRNIMRVPRDTIATNNATDNTTTKVKRESDKNVTKVSRDEKAQNITRTKRDKSQHLAKDSRDSANITRAERKIINETAEDEPKNYTKMSKGNVKLSKNRKRVRRDVSEHTYENSTRTGRDVSELNNATKSEEIELEDSMENNKSKRRISREISKQRKVTKNSDANVNQNKNTTLNSTEKVEAALEKIDITKSGKSTLIAEDDESKDAVENSEIQKNSPKSSVNKQNNDFEVRSSQNVGNESKEIIVENGEDNSEVNTDDSAEADESDASKVADDKSKIRETNNEADNNRLRRNQRKSNNTSVKHHYDRNDTRIPRFSKMFKNNTSNLDGSSKTALTGRNERVEINSALKIAVPIDGNPAETRAVLSKTKRSRGDDNDSDVEYILVHDVPPCKRRKRSGEYDPSEQYESKLLNGNRKNITIIIQNLVASMREKRGASDFSNITDTEQAKNDNATDRVKRENIQIDNVKSPKAQNDTKTHEHRHRSRREVDAFNPEKETKCCPPKNKQLDSLGDGNEILISENEKISKPITRNSEIPEPIGVPSKKKPNQVDQPSKQVKKEIVTATRPKKSGRSLLSVVESVNENGIDKTDFEVTKGSFIDFDGSPKSSPNIHRDLIGNVEPHYFGNGQGREIRMPTEKISKPVDKVKCACAIYFDDPESKEKSPFVVESFLEYPQGATAGDREIICSRTCSESSKLYYKMKQVVLCTHVKNFHHHLQTIMPIEHTPEEDDESETIFCQVVPGEAEPPLRYIVSWLNIILLDVVVCLTGLGIVCVYLICFVTWKKRDAIPIYTSASFTVK